MFLASSVLYGEVYLHILEHLLHFSHIIVCVLIVSIVYSVLRYFYIKANA